jgi:predicted component of type VI protein secretion system
MKRLIALVLVAGCLSGCTSTIEDATPVPEPRKIDCNLIFPGGSSVAQ